MAEVFAPFNELLDSHLHRADLESGGLVTAFDYQAALADDATDALLAEQSKRLAAFERDGLDAHDIA